MAVLHVYVELLAAGVDAVEHYPGLASDLTACGPCADDAYGLLAAVQDHDLQYGGSDDQSWPHRRACPRDFRT